MRAYAAIATSGGAAGEEGRAGEVVAEGVWQEGERGDGIGDAEVGTEADSDGAGGLGQAHGIGAVDGGGGERFGRSEPHLYA